MIKNIKIFPNNNELSYKISKELAKKLIFEGYNIVEDNYDLAIAIGGDGSFLRMLKQNNYNSNIFYIGVNTGTLGFLQEIKPDELDSFIISLKDNKYKIDTVGIQETRVYYNNDNSIFYSLNDIVVRDKDLNATVLKINIDDVNLEKFVGDGILISTSVGSTAYNLSYGGSIVFNTLHTLQIIPIGPINSKAYKSLLNGIVIPEDKTITIIPNKDKKNLIITVDGVNNVYDNVERIETSVSKKRIKCLRMENYNFINIVNDKFLK